MKKTTVLLGILMAGISIFAQENDKPANVTSEIKSEFKQNAGDKNLELNLDPAEIFNSSRTGNFIGLQDNFGIRYRKFRSSSLAIRMGVNLLFLNFTDITQTATGTLLELKDKNRTIEIMIRPGLEKHFEGTEKLSPYIGGELLIGFQTSTFISESQSGSAVSEFKITNGSPDDGLTIGLGGVAGVDYYFARKFYLGLELNYSIVYFAGFTEKIKPPSGLEVENKNGSRFAFFPSAYTALRIGFLF